MQLYYFLFSGPLNSYIGSISVLPGKGQFVRIQNPLQCFSFQIILFTIVLQQMFMPWFFIISFQQFYSSIFQQGIFRLLSQPAILSARLQIVRVEPMYQPFQSRLWWKKKTRLFFFVTMQKYLFGLDLNSFMTELKIRIRFCCSRKSYCSALPNFVKVYDSIFRYILSN